MIEKINVSEVFQVQSDSNKAKTDFTQKLTLQVNLLEASLKHLEKALSKVEEMKIKEQEAILKSEQKALKDTKLPKSDKELILACTTMITRSQKALKLAYKKAVSRPRGGGLGDSGPGSGVPGYFNPKVPGTWAGAGSGTDDPGSSVLGKLWLMLQYLEANPHNPQALKDLQQYLKNVIKVYGNDPAKLAQLFGMLNKISGDGNTLTEFLIKFIAAEYYFAHRGKESEAQILAGLKAMLAKLKALGVPGLGPEIAGLTDFIDNFSSWVNKVKGESQADWEKSEGDALAQLFSASNASGNGINSVIAELREINLKALLAKYKGNPMIAIMLWFFQEQDVQSEASLAGFAALIKYIDNEINNLKGLEDKFRKGGFTPAAAKKWYALLLQIQKDVDNNPALKGIASQIDGAVKAIGGLPDPNAPTPATNTIAKYFADGDYAGVAVILNNLSGDLTSPQGQIYLNNVKQLNTSFSDQSTITNTLIQKTTSMIQTVLNALNKTVNEGAMTMITSFVKSQRSN